MMSASFSVARISFTDEAFQFKGSMSASAPLLARGLFATKEAIRKPIIIRREAILEETNSETLALVSMDKDKQISMLAVASLKRGRPLSPTAS